jgi:Mrp family chromosome partitioning ATPase
MSSSTTVTASSRLGAVSQPSSAEDPSGVPQKPEPSEQPMAESVEVESVEVESAEVESAEVESVEVDPVEVVLRRAPRYRPFVGSGAAFGAVLLLVSGLVAVRGKSFTTVMLPLDLLLIGALVGGLVGAGAALLLERRRPT